MRRPRRRVRAEHLVLRCRVTLPRRRRPEGGLLSWLWRRPGGLLIAVLAGYSWLPARGRRPERRLIVVLTDRPVLRCPLAHGSNVRRHAARGIGGIPWRNTGRDRSVTDRRFVIPADRRNTR